jgi:glycerophosphoryl diester phosphodiesterase
VSGPRLLPSRQGRPLVIAHRGASGERPENTLPAYELAIEQRADAIEIDLHTTRDGAIVVTHDAELADLSGCGEVGEASLAEVRALDAGGGARIPTLDEVLDGFGGRIPFNVEIKTSEKTGRYLGLEAAALAAIEQRELLETTLFSSFDDSVLAELRRISAQARIGVLVSPRVPRESLARTLARARSVTAEAINPHFVMVDEALVGAAHSQGLAVFVYTVDAEPEMERLLDLGVDGIFTNHPRRLRAVVDGRV